MKKDDCIAAVARLFGVAPSALRYWDRIGLVRFERDEQNNYRRPCVQTGTAVIVHPPARYTIAAGYGRQPSRRPARR